MLQRFLLGIMQLGFQRICFAASFGSSVRTDTATHAMFSSCLSWRIEAFVYAELTHIPETRHGRLGFDTLSSRPRPLAHICYPEAPAMHPQQRTSEV